MRTAMVRACAAITLVLVAATAMANRIDVAASGKVGVVVVAADGQCSLREAMLLGNNASANSDCVATPDGNAELTISLPPGTRFMLMDGPYAADGPNGLPDVTAKYKIMAHGSTIKRSDTAGTARFRLLHVASSGELFVDGAWFVNGLTPDGVIGVDDGAAGAGGGIYNLGTLTLAGVAVEYNATGHGSNLGQGDIYAGDGGKGGGIYNAGVLTLFGAVVDGNATGAGGNCVDDECIGGSGGDGGGIYNAGVLTAFNSRINDNVAADGGNASVVGDAAGGAGGDGGGIYNTNELTLDDSTVGHNKAGNGGLGEYASYGGSGGGIYSISSQVVLATNVTIVDNQAGVSGIVDGIFGDGGGIYCQGSLTLTDSEVTNNAIPAGNGDFGSGSGGGIFNTNGVLSIATSTISDNLNEVGDGGGIAAYNGTSMSVYRSSLFGNLAARDGGALYSENLTTIVNTTIADNTAQSGSGGGLMILLPGSRISYTTISGNSGGGLDTGRGNQAIATVDHSIIAMQSTGADCYGDYLPISTGYNLDSDGSCEFEATGDLSNANPILGALSDNGGPTMSMAPMDGSPVLDAIPTSACASNTPSGFDLGVDQRGMTRPVPGTNCDMGAVEQFVGTLRGLGQDDQQALTGDMFRQPLVVQAFDDFGGAVAGVLLDVQVPSSDASASCIGEPTDGTGIGLVFCTANATAGTYTVHISIQGSVYSSDDISYTLTNVPNDRIFGTGFDGTALPTAEILP